MTINENKNTEELNMETKKNKVNDIHLLANYYLGADKFNYILKKEVTVRKKVYESKTSGSEVYTPEKAMRQIGFYSSIEQLLSSLKDIIARRRDFKWSARNTE